jgi:hypothetical protein
MLADITGSALGCLLFIPILLSPGYVAAWLTGVFGFRTLTAPWRLLISLPLSVAIGPIVIFLAGNVLAGGNPSLTSYTEWLPVYGLYAACFLIWLALLCGLGGHETLPRWLAGLWRVPRVWRVIPAVWLVVAIGSLVNIQFHSRLYLSFSDFDHTTRAAITDAISRTGVRPLNPFYDLGSLAPLRYHYFWFLLCSLVTQMGGALLSSAQVSSQQAIIASVVWCGWSLIALAPLYLRFLHEQSGAALRRCSLVAVGLFTVTGLDLIPLAIYYVVVPEVFPEMEWWNEQVASWYGSLVWVPHHVGALIACLIGFLLLWDAGTTTSLRRRIAGSALAGIAFASATGTSIYVALVFVIFLCVWFLVTLARRWWDHTKALLMTSVVSILLVWPYLHSLAGGTSPGGGTAAAGGSFVRFEVRQFWPLNDMTHGATFTPLKVAMMRLAVLPLNYFLELGFFGIASIVFLIGLRKYRPLRPGVIAGITMAAVSVLVCTFLRSGTIEGNDLGWRGFLPAQFIMLLWAAELLVQRGTRAEALGQSFRGWWLRSPVWAPLILLGVLGTCYEVVMLRTYFLLNDADIVWPTKYAPDRSFGARALELRRAYDALDHILPRTAHVQSSPEGRYFNFYFGLYSNKQTVVGDRACGAVFGGDPAPCPAALAEVSAIFDGGLNVNWEKVRDTCRRLSIDALVVTDFDRAWGSQSWAWQTTPVISGDHVRVYLPGDPHL